MISRKTQFLNAARAVLFRSTGLDRLLPLITSGREASSLIAKLPPNPRQYPSPTTRKAKRNGIRYELDISDFMEWCVYFGVVIEPREVLYSLMKVGDVVVDVGANIGEVTLSASLKVGPQGWVYSFEANPLVYDKLVRNISLNEVANVTAFNVGLSDRSACVRFSAPQGNRGGGAVVADEGAGGTFDVHLEMLDELWAKKDARIGVMKVDVEGHEYRVLKGAENTIRRCRPRLFVEVNDSNLRRHDSSARELLTFIADLGYTIADAGTGTKLSPNDDLTGRHLDIAALP